MIQRLRTNAGRVLNSTRDQTLLAGTLAYLAALETVGRIMPPEALLDLFLVTALLVGGLWLAQAHSRVPVSWITFVTRRFRRAVRNLRPYTYQIGWDLRKAPPIPRRAPPGLLVLVVGCELLLAGTLVWLVWQPMSARELIGGVSRVGFAAAQFVLWCALFRLIVTVLLIGPSLLRELDLFRQRAFRLGRRSVHQGWFLLLFVTLCAGGAILAPVCVATVILAGTYLAGSASIWLVPHRDFDFIWQPRGRAVVYAMSRRTFISLMHSVTILVCLLLLFLAVGPESVGMPGNASGTASVSRVLGILASWVTATGAMFFVWPRACVELTARWCDPAIPAPTRVRVSGALTRDERRRIRGALRRRGWSVVFGPSGAATDVFVQVPNGSPATTTDSGWPRCVLPDGFDDEDLQWSIARRDQIQRRRVFLRTLESLLKQARRRRFEQGGGFWIAPQYWFVLGITRDHGDDGEPPTRLDVAPTLYHRAFPRPVRQHFHEVCRALEVDLLYLEDGVPWRGFRRVLRMMFEHYDVHGGSRIEELHFTGLPRVRVIIQEFELGAAWERGQYPEPDFEDLARARVVHVFRDRGEEDVPRETPMDWDRLPSPVPAGTMGS